MQIVDTDKDQLIEQARAALESAKRENGGCMPAVDDLIEATEAIINAVWISNIVELQPGKHYMIPVSPAMSEHEVALLSESLTKANITFSIIRK